MVFKKGEPWLLWPEKDSLGMDVGDVGSLLNGETDFTISFDIDLIEFEPEKRTIFAMLPNYCGFDVEGFNLTFILTRFDDNGNKKSNYFWYDNVFTDTNNIFTFRYKKNEKKIEILLNSDILEVVHCEDINFNSKDKTHVIFGAGNFPSNDYNLNYATYDAKKLLFSKEFLSYETIIELFTNDTIKDKTIAQFNFQEKTDYKIYDITGNCNFLNKII